MAVTLWPCSQSFTTVQFLQYAKMDGEGLGTLSCEWHWCIYLGRQGWRGPKQKSRFCAYARSSSYTMNDNFLALPTFGIPTHGLMLQEKLLNYHVDDVNVCLDTSNIIAVWVSLSDGYIIAPWFLQLLVWHCHATISHANQYQALPLLFIFCQGEERARERG